MCKSKNRSLEFGCYKRNARRTYGAVLTYLALIGCLAVLAVSGYSPAEAATPGVYLPDQVNGLISPSSWANCGVSGGSLFQSFTANSSSLARVRILLRALESFSSPSQTEIKIRVGVPEGAVLATASTNVVGSPISDVVATFVFLPPISLTPGHEWGTGLSK